MRCLILVLLLFSAVKTNAESYLDASLHTGEKLLYNYNLDVNQPLGLYIMYVDSSMSSEGDEYHRMQIERLINETFSVYVSTEYDIVRYTAIGAVITIDNYKISIDVDESYHSVKLSHTTRTESFKNQIVVKTHSIDGNVKFSESLRYAVSSEVSLVLVIAVETNNTPTTDLKLGIKF